MNVLALLKVIKSHDEKRGIYFIVTKAIHTNKDNCDRKSADKNVHILYDCMKDKIIQSRVRLDSGREPNLSGSESDMYTVHVRSKICPCVPPCTRRTL